MSLSRFRLITFDVTDTLLQFRSSPGKQYGELGAMFGVLCDNNDFAHNFKSNWYKMNRAHPNFGLKTRIGWESWWQKLIISTFRDSGVKIEQEKLTKLSGHLIEIFKTSTCWQPCSGAMELLNYLKLQQQIKSKLNDGRLTFKMGVISNFDHRLDVLLRNMKVNHFFDFVLNSYDAGCEKPDKEIFERAIKEAEMEDLNPNECLHIGDTPITDYIGARAAGWHGALIHEKDPKLLKLKYGDKIDDHHVFGSLFDFHKKVSNDYVHW